MHPPAPSIASSSSSAPSDAAKRILPWLVAVAFFMESLDTTISDTAVPAISLALGVAPLSMKAVLASYTLKPCGFHPDQRMDGGSIGTRSVFASAIGLFTLGSFLLWNIEQHSPAGACRILQGLRRIDDGCPSAA